MSFLIFSEKEGFLNDELAWTPKPSEAQVVPAEQAESLVSQVVSKGLRLVPQNLCTLVLSEQLTSWVADSVFEKTVDDIERFCSKDLDISCERLGENSWIVYQAGGHRIRCDTVKMRHFADEVLKLMTGKQVFALAKAVLGHSVYQIGADAVAIKAA